jgi:DNA-binding response OmpR family regulator
LNVRPPPHSAPQADCAPEVEPRPASGSTDHLPAGRGIGEHPDSAQAPAGPPADLLIVEDDRNSLMLLEALLRDDGFVIRTAASGHEGLACCRQRAPDLMLLDIGIPPPDGLAVLRELKADARLRQIPVLLLTGRGDPASKALAFRLGAHDYLTKPVEETELRARLSHHLSQARLNQGLIRRLAAYQARFGALDERALPMDADERAAGQVAQLWQARDLIERHPARHPQPGRRQIDAVWARFAVHNAGDFTRRAPNGAAAGADRCAHGAGRLWALDEAGGSSPSAATGALPMPAERDRSHRWFLFDLPLAADADRDGLSARHRRHGAPARPAAHRPPAPRRGGPAAYAWLALLFGALLFMLAYNLLLLLQLRDPAYLWLCCLIAGVIIWVAGSRRPADDPRLAALAGVDVRHLRAALGYIGIFLFPVAYLRLRSRRRAGLGALRAVLLAASLPLLSGSRLGGRCAGLRPADSAARRERRP